MNQGLSPVKKLDLSKTRRDDTNKEKKRTSVQEKKKGAVLSARETVGERVDGSPEVKRRKHKDPKVAKGPRSPRRRESSKREEKSPGKVDSGSAPSSRQMSPRTPPPQALLRPTPPKNLEITGAFKRSETSPGMHLDSLSGEKGDTARGERSPRATPERAALHKKSNQELEFIRKKQEASIRKLKEKLDVAKSFVDEIDVEQRRRLLATPETPRRRGTKARAMDTLEQLDNALQEFKPENSSVEEKH